MEQVISASLSHSPLFTLSHPKQTHMDTVMGTIHSGDQCLCSCFRFGCVGMCTWCSDMEQRAEITHCRVFVCICVCVCVTRPCHSITGHPNLIIQLWAQWAGVYERDCSVGEHRPQSVTTLPFAQWQAVSGPTLIARSCFPDWLLWEWAAFQFNLDTSAAPVRHVTVNKRSHLASQIHYGLSDTWRMSRCDGRLRRLRDKAVISVTYRLGWDKRLSSPPWNHIDRKCGPLRWTLRYLLWFIILGPSCEGWQLIQIFSGSISWAAWGKRDQYFSFLTQRQYRPHETGSSAGMETFSSLR